MNTELLNNRYQVIQVLGAGGFGETFLAEDTHMPSRRRCVIKKLKAITGDPRTYDKIKQRFEREAATLEILGESSDQIPKLYAYFSEQGLFYLIQEWIQGQTLTQIIETKGVLSEREVKSILLNLLSVLDYVHSKGIIHRDIKPDNVILSAGDHKPVLIDFGAVKETVRTVVNSPGGFTESLIIGTPGYMPSEQAIGRPIYATDIYSLGLTAIFLLTGKGPQELQTDRQTGEICWHEYAPGVSPEFVQVLDQAVKLQAGDRFTTASKMLQALESQTTLSPSTIPVKPQPATQKTVAISPPNAVRSNQLRQTSSHDGKTDVVGVPSPNVTSTVWQRPPVIIGSLILGSLIGGIAISSFAISSLERQEKREENFANSNVVDSNVVDSNVTPSSVSPSDQNSQANSLPSPSPTPEAGNTSATSPSRSVDNSSVSTAPVATEEVPQETQEPSENTQPNTPTATDQQEENTQSNTPTGTEQQEENTQSRKPPNTFEERDNTEAPVNFTLPDQENPPESSPEEKPEEAESAPPEAEKPATDNNSNENVPAFPVGTTKDTIKAALGKPSKVSRGAHGNTRAHLYSQPNNLDIDLGLIIDRNSGVLRQTEVTFTQSAGQDVMERRLQGMLGGNMSGDIKQELGKVYQRQKRQHRFEKNGLKGIIQRNQQDKIYIAVWDSKLH